MRQLQRVMASHTDDAAAHGRTRRIHAAVLLSDMNAVRPRCAGKARIVVYQNRNAETPGQRYKNLDTFPPDAFGIPEFIREEFQANLQT